MLRRVAIALMMLIAVVACFCGNEGVAMADRRAEAAAKDALKKAEDDHLRMEFDKGKKRLQTAERRCGESGCTTATHAALLRDIGVMEFRAGNKDAALASFLRAKKLDPTIAINPSYDAPDLREAWNGPPSSQSSTPTGANPQSTGATTAPTTTGDFTHAPAAEASARTPLPVYVEPTTSEVLTSVVVKYKNDSMRTFRRAVLKRHGSSGWGGTIPCADVLVGTISYYVQGFDKDSELVANAGDPKHTFTVAIREHISGPPPSLPGEPPPQKCSDEDIETLNLDDGERCHEDRHCKSGICSAERCKSAGEPAESAEGSHDYARFWVGVAGSVDITVASSDANTCKLANGVSTNGYWCTTPTGNDYPANNAQNDALVNGPGGTSSNGITTGGIHITAAFDYAASASLLLGVRFGFVAASYPGSAATNAGKTLGAPLHAEVHATYLFGEEPLARTGLAPYLFIAAGAARFDASSTTLVREQNVVGERAVQAWRVAGPAFGAFGGGARYAFSPRIAFFTGLRFTAAIGPGAFAPSVGPELQLQYGF